MTSCLNYLLLVLFAQITVESTEANTFGRIVGGQVVNARSYEFPFFMSIIYKPNPKVLNMTFCGGTLINELYVLTAAHCLAKHEKMPESLAVFTSKGKFTDPSTVIYNAEKIFIHPEHKTIDLDIGLLKLKEPVKINNGRSNGPSPLCLHKNKDFKLRPGQSVTILGRGDQIENDMDNNAPLKKLQVKLESAKYCRNRLRQKSHKMCTSAPGKKGHTLFGDSGGSVIANHRGSQRLIGVLTEGNRVINFVTKLSSAYDWVLSTLRQDSRIELCKM